MAQLSPLVLQDSRPAGFRGGSSTRLGLAHACFGEGSQAAEAPAQQWQRKSNPQKIARAAAAAEAAAEAAAALAAAASSLGQSPQRG